MSKGRGRPNKYETHVKPRLKEIEEMCQTMTEKQIAQYLGVAYSSWNEYKTKYSELTETIKKGRFALVKELKSTLIRKAKGFHYTEKKIIKEKGVIIREEIYEKASLPDVAALNLLLKNYDADNWSNDPQMLKLREKEIQLRERQIENNEW
jgi:hypothetical protein